VRSLVPARPDEPDGLLDASIAFCRLFFSACPSFPVVEAQLGDLAQLDFHLRAKKVPKAWGKLREEARPLFRTLNLLRADLVPVNQPSTAYPWL
jgi:hypothetical protein